MTQDKAAAYAYQLAPMSWVWGQLSPEIKTNLLTLAVFAHGVRPSFYSDCITGNELRERLAPYARDEWEKLSQELQAGVMKAVLL